MGLDDIIPTPDEWLTLANTALHKAEPSREEWRTLVSNGMWVIQGLREKLRLQKVEILKHISYSGSSNGDCGKCGHESVEIYDTIYGDICWKCVRETLESK